MFEQLSGFFKKGSHETLVLACTEVPAWIDDHIREAAADPAGTAEPQIGEIGRIIARLRENLRVLQEAEAAGSPGTEHLEIFRTSLTPFIRQLSGPLSEEIAGETCRFFLGAEEIFTRCTEAIAEHGQILNGVFPLEIAALHENTAALGHELAGARIPLERCRTRKQQVARVREVLSMIADIDEDAAGSAERMSWIKNQIEEITGDISRIRTDLADLDADPGPFLARQQEEHDHLAAEREKIRHEYTTRADIASALMAWARTIATDKNDSYAGDVLFELIQVLTASDMPDADLLMSELACAFPIVLDMVDNGDLVPGDDEAGALLKKPAEFNNELCRICRQYAETDAHLLKIPVGPQALEQRKHQLKDEDHRLEALLLAHETAAEDLKNQQALAAMHRQNMVRPLEDALSLLSGLPVQVRLNGQEIREPGPG